MKSWVRSYEYAQGHRSVASRRFANFVLTGGVFPSKRKVPHNPRTRRIAELPTKRADVEPSPPPKDQPTQKSVLRERTPLSDPSRYNKSALSRSPSKSSNEVDTWIKRYVACQEDVAQQRKDVRTLEAHIRALRRDLARCNQTKNTLHAEIDALHQPDVEEEEEQLIDELDQLHQVDQDDQDHLDRQDRQDRQDRAHTITVRLDEIAQARHEQNEEQKREIERLKEEWLLNAVAKATEEGTTPPTKTPWDPPQSLPTPPKAKKKIWYKFWT